MSQDLIIDQMLRSEKREMTRMMPRVLDAQEGGCGHSSVRWDHWRKSRGGGNDESF